MLQGDLFKLLETTADAALDAHERVLNTAKINPDMRKLVRAI